MSGRAGWLAAPTLGRVRAASWGSQFRWLWAAFAVSAFGTWLAFDALSMVAILAVHASPVEVSLLAAAGLAVGAVIAVPLGPSIDARRKRRVMIGLDALRFLALASIPVAWALGRLGFGQLVAVAVVVGAADICFRAASGACLKALVPGEHLLGANARLESTQWAATMLGPPLGGALIAMLGPVATVVADAVSYLLSALGLSRIAADEPRPVPPGSGRRRHGALLEGWRYLVTHRELRALLANNALVAGLIMATTPLVAVLMLGRLGIAPWQYGLAFAAPCLGGLVGARLSRRLTARVGRQAVLRWTGTLRAVWSVGLAFVPAGWAGVAVVTVLQLGLVTCMGVFNPVLATYRLEHIPDDRLACTLAAWQITSKATVAALTALWGVLAALVGLRAAIAVAGVVMLATPLLLPRGAASRSAVRVLSRA